jgi:ribosome-binding ATPase YchF (GTP1/OBG family)
MHPIIGFIAYEIIAFEDMIKFGSQAKACEGVQLRIQGK